jgi:serine/threonine protein kinase
MQATIPSQAGLTLNEEITRDYAVLKLLGRGGIGEVYLAEQLHVGRRPVALKVLNRSFSQDPAMLSRFKNEAAIAGNLDHENIVKIYDCRVTSEGQVYVAMEYVQGSSLRDVLKQSGALPLPIVVGIANQVCAGLHAAHQMGVVHRDIKPDNIMLLRKDGRLVAKVLDFGIARFASPDLTQTSVGMVIGSACYMSPEQAEGLTGEHIDARSDVYSLGMVVYEMLTGRVAFQGNSWTEIVYRQRHEQPPAPRSLRPDIPPGVEQVVLKALQKDRAARQQSALEFARDLVASVQMGSATILDDEAKRTHLKSAFVEAQPGEGNNIMFCQKCGMQVSAKAVGCSRCGESIAAPNPAALAADKVKAASKDAWQAFKLFASDPVAGLSAAFESLGQASALGAGIVFGALFALCVIFEIYQLLPVWIRPGFIDILVIAVVPFISLLGAIALGRKAVSGEGGFAADSFIAGASLLPFGVVMLVAGLVGLGNFEAIAVFTLFASCLTILMLFAGLTRICKISERAATILVPLLLIVTAWLSEARA